MFLAKDVRIQDIPTLAYEIWSSRSDFDGDSRVGMGDLLALSSRWLRLDCGDSGWCAGVDLNCDGRVDFVDFGILAQDWAFEGD
jgi:hypothetical protein